jgi:hypothetical protein
LLSDAPDEDDELNNEDESEEYEYEENVRDSVVIDDI